jgi:hypothetical protein
MSKKKKKVNTQAQQKVQAAQHRKQFMERLRKLCTYIGDGEPLFDVLPNFMLTAIYENRSIMPKIKVAPDVKITKRLIKILYCHLEKDMQSMLLDLKIPGFDKTVTLVDYYQILLPLEAVLSSKTCMFTGKEKFDAFCVNMDDRYDTYDTLFLQMVSNACSVYCDLSKRCLYTFKYDAHRTEIGVERYSGFFYQIVTLETYPLDVRYVSIHGDRRPVVQVGVISEDGGKYFFYPTTVPLRRLYLKDPSGEKSIPVYIQQHAVDRTMQRACCDVPGKVPMMIHQAFLNKRRIICEGERYFVECHMNDIKIGYFVGMYISEIFVIVTFLLITHSSTPEGRKLAKLTGLQRDDMSFLAIDDLKTLVNSDIPHHNSISKIFLNAGCGSILKMNRDIHTKGYYQWLRDDAKQDTELSKLIAEYIRLGASDEEYFEND